MNWLRKLSVINQSTPDVATSRLCNEATFYNQFIRDLIKAKEEVIIESPFITTKRLKMLIPTFEKLVYVSMVFIVKLYDQ